jgi:uncharacterized protein with ACT and thioredoxin-like domain
MITIERNGKLGVLTGIIVKCDTAEQAEQLAQLSTYWRVDGTTVSGYGAKKDVQKIESVIERMNSIAAKSENKTAGKIERIMVPSGKYQVGEVLHGHRITGFGREFTPNADQYSAHGIDPWVDTVCYAYFN